MSEKKSLLEMVVMPITVSLISIVGAVYLTQQQNKNTVYLTTQQNNSLTFQRRVEFDNAKALADGERQIKILELFAAKITSPNPREQKLALQLQSIELGSQRVIILTVGAAMDPKDSGIFFA